MKMSAIDKTDVPGPLQHLIQMATEWGLGDDYDREEKVSSSTTKELESLVHSIDEVSDEDLFGWLEGEEAYSETPSEAYVAFTCLTMAIDSAKIELERRSIPPFGSR